MLHHFDFWWAKVTAVLEKVIAVGVAMGVIAFILLSIPVFSQLDWSSIDAFYELVNRALAIMIGLELMRMLISHSIGAVLELLAFVIARKMLHPEISSLDIFLSVVAFVLLMAARHYFMERSFEEEWEEKKMGKKMEMTND